MGGCQEGTNYELASADLIGSKLDNDNLRFGLTTRLVS